MFQTQVIIWLFSSPFNNRGIQYTFSEYMCKSLISVSLINHAIFMIFENIAVTNFYDFWESSYIQLNWFSNNLNLMSLEYSLSASSVVTWVGKLQPVHQTGLTDTDFCKYRIQPHSFIYYLVTIFTLQKKSSNRHCMTCKA